jgi:hydrogenase maturation protease
MKSTGSRSPIRIIGIGNAMRGDDAVGLLAARRLQEALGDRDEVIEADGVGVELLELMKGAQMALLIDSVRSGRTPGTIHRLDASIDPVASEPFSSSTHAIGVAEAVELARVLGVLPATVIIYGVEAGNVEAGRPLSPPVAKALDEVVGLVIQECDACHA